MNEAASVRVVSLYVCTFVRRRTWGEPSVRSLIHIWFFRSLSPPLTHSLSLISSPLPIQTARVLLSHYLTYLLPSSFLHSSIPLSTGREREARAQLHHSTSHNTPNICKSQPEEKKEDTRNTLRTRMPFALQIPLTCC